MKNLESSYEKNIGTPKGTTATEALLMLVSVTTVSLFSLSSIIISDPASQFVVAEEAQPESISRKSDNGTVLDNGIMIFNASSSKGGELSFLDNTVAAYKDMIDLRRGNLTTIAWKWK